MDFVGSNWCSVWGAGPKRFPEEPNAQIVLMGSQPFHGGIRGLLDVGLVKDIIAIANMSLTPPFSCGKIVSTVGPPHCSQRFI
jgi:hypothetical protein